MDDEALNLDLGRGGVEVLIFQLALVTSVYGVSEVTPEALHVKIVGSAPYLLIRIEGYSDGTMLYLRMVAEIAHRLHYLGYACLIVSSEKGRTVSLYDALPTLLHYLCLDVGSGTVGLGVIMRYKPYDRLGGGIDAVGRQGAVEIPLFGQNDILQPLFYHLIPQEAGKDELLGRRRNGI